MKKFGKAVSILVVLAMTMTVALLAACGDPKPDPKPDVGGVARITVKTDDAKTVYEIGETFSAEGVVVTAFMDDGEQKTVSVADCTVSSPDMTQAGKKSVTVTYGGKSANYMITVNAPKAHECVQKCPVCEGCLDPDCTEQVCETKCGENPMYKTYWLEAEDERVEKVGGARGGLGVTAVKDDPGASGEIKERNKDIVYVSNYNANAGASINYTVYSPKATAATLYASVCKRLQSAIFTQGVGLIVNDDMLERPTVVPSTGVNTDTWVDFVEVNLGCISLVKGNNFIKLTNVSSDFGYNFDKIVLKTDAQIGWSENEPIPEEVDKNLYDETIDSVGDKTFELGETKTLRLRMKDKGTVKLSMNAAAAEGFTEEQLKAAVTVKLDGEEIEVHLTEPFKGVGEENYVKIAFGEETQGYNDLESGIRKIEITLAEGAQVTLENKLGVNAVAYRKYYVYGELRLNTDSVKKEYKLGEELDLTGLTVKAVTRGGEEVDVDLADCKITAPDMSALGMKRVVVTAQNASAEFIIDVKPNENVVIFEGEDERTVFTSGTLGALNRAVKEPGSLVTYVGNFNANVGASITWNLVSSEECDVTLYVSVCKRSSAHKFTDIVEVTVGGEKQEFETEIPGLEAGEGDWVTFVTVKLGTVHLTKGKNVVTFTVISSDAGAGYNFDNMQLGVPEGTVVDWYTDPQA
ncbi:MAG: hypothetical protein HFE48_06505 [Clostridia bacterium]|nr:hypothetical protein [Clostridia bacterium]